ncbi:hypothetical protein MPSEU_000327000 [Mayamaea pseudoterrestris]|nr:hypothetical protein MPSEU_000327000 [Mayamaea pseudoterrestris]
MLCYSQCKLLPLLLQEPLSFYSRLDHCLLGFAAKCLEMSTTDVIGIFDVTNAEQRPATQPPPHVFGATLALLTHVLISLGSRPAAISHPIRFFTSTIRSFGAQVMSFSLMHLHCRIMADGGDEHATQASNYSLLDCLKTKPTNCCSSVRWH